jgi:hypothetical protein
MQEIFKFVRTSTSEDDSVEGHFLATSVRPRFLSELAARGLKIPATTSIPASRCNAVPSARLDPSGLSLGDLGRTVRQGVYLLFFKHGHIARTSIVDSSLWPTAQSIHAGAASS